MKTKRGSISAYIFNKHKTFFAGIAVIFVVSATFADTAVLVDGTQHHGIIVNITDESIVLKSGNNEMTFLRPFVKEIIFERSDLLVLTSGDTLQGKVLLEREGQIVTDLENGIRAIGKDSIVSVMYFGGGPLVLREFGRTNEAFQSQNPVLKKRRSPFFAAVYMGTEKVSYSYAGNPSHGPQAFERTASDWIYAIEVGGKLSERFALAAGVTWYNGPISSGKPPGGIIQPTAIGYTSTFLAGSYFPFQIGPGDFDLAFRLKLAFLRCYSGSGTSSLSGSANSPSSGEGKFAIVPGCVISYNLWLPLQVFGELDVPSSTLQLGPLGESIDIGGALFMAGLRFYFVNSAKP